MSDKLLSRFTKNKKYNSGPAEKESQPTAEIAIDYPREEELVAAGQYAIRLSGSADAQVEISINNSEWQGCRASVGHYWFDWEPEKPGEYVLNARLRAGKGRWKQSDQRYCRVVSGKKN